MTRLKQAWLALCGKPLPVRFVLADESSAIVPVFARVSYDSPSPYYLSCQQAHEESPGGQIVQVPALKVGGLLYRFPYGELRQIEIQPKPKVAKGKRRNG